jgi:hypothetical protein
MQQYSNVPNQAGGSYPNQFQGMPPQPKKKSMLPLILGLIGGFVVLVLIAAGTGFYFLLYVPSQVATSMNKNIDVMNALADKTSPLIEDVKALETKVDSFSSQEASTYDEIASDTQGVQTQSQALKTDYQNAPAQLNAGPNDDTKAFKTTMEQYLNSSKKAVEDINNYSKFLICMSQNASKEFSSSEKMVAAVSQLGGSSTSADLISSVSNVNKIVPDMVAAVEEYDTCAATEGTPTTEKQTFLDEHAKYVAYLKEFQRIFLVYEDAFKTKDQAKFEKAKAEYTKLKYDTKAFKEVVVNLNSAFFDTISADSDKADKDFKTVDQQRKDLFKKYNITEEKAVKSTDDKAKG